MPGVDGAFGGEHRNGRQWRVKAATNYFPLTRDFSQPTRDSYSGLAPHDRPRSERTAGARRALCEVGSPIRTPEARASSSGVIRRGSGTSLLPKEHGAYGQISVPLITAFLAAGVSTTGLLIATAMLAGFLAHEPAFVLIGARGARAKRDLRQRAIRWLGCTLAVGIAAAAGVGLTIDTALRWALLVPIAPAFLLAILAARGREKTWPGEVAAALAFSGAAVPVSLSAGASLATAVAVAIPFALLFVASTLAVRVVILQVRGGGDRQAAMATRRAALSVAAGGGATLALSAAAGLLATSVLVAAAPGLLIAAAIAAQPPSPTHLRALGWTLVAASVVTAAIVVATA